MWRLLLLLLMPFSSLVKAMPKPQATKRPPAITYVAGPNQLTLMTGPNAFRFGYHTNDQFRAERRYPNGTVVGYYGYIRADGVPVRVSYGDINGLGFNANQEIIPLQFESNPETTTPAVDDRTTTEVPPANVNRKVIATDFVQSPHNLFVVDNERESISVDASDYLNNNIETRSNKLKKFVFPKIDFDLNGGKVKRSLPDAMPLLSPPLMAAEETKPSTEQIVFRRRLTKGQVIGEPDVIYADRRVLTAQAHFTVGEA